MDRVRKRELKGDSGGRRVTAVRVIGIISVMRFDHAECRGRRGVENTLSVSPRVLVKL